jgi:PAS domain S-box-containing protein
MTRVEEKKLRAPSAKLIEDLAALRREVELMEAAELRLNSIRYARPWNTPLFTALGTTRTQQAEEEFTRFFNQSLDLLCIAGFDGYFKRLNPAWTTLLGWTHEEMESKPFLDFVHPDDHQATLAEVSKLAEGVVTILFENRYRHQDGSYRWLRWNARPVRGRKRIYAIARDVTRQKQMEREILEIADREKERLGRELHDGLCQKLAGIAALSATLSKSLGMNSEPAASATATEITKLLNEANTEARNMAHCLGPLSLSQCYLDRALETLALNVHHLFRVSCTFECDRPYLKLGREVEAHLFRIAQEAVNNGVFHGRAKQIEISLKTQEGVGLLSVRDDGVGIPEEAHNSDGIGMHTMAYRSRLIGGSLEVRMRARRGTVVSCAFPLPATPRHPRNP